MNYIYKPPGATPSGATVIPFRERPPATEKKQLPERDPGVDADGFNVIRHPNGDLIGYVKSRVNDDGSVTWEAYGPTKQFVGKSPSPATAINAISTIFYQKHPEFLRRR